MKTIFLLVDCLSIGAQLDAQTLQQVTGMPAVLEKIQGRTECYN